MVRCYTDHWLFVHSIGTLSILSLIVCWTASGFHLGISIVRIILFISLTPNPDLTLQMDGWMDGQARREPARAPGQTTFRAPPHPLPFPPFPSFPFSPHSPLPSPLPYSSPPFRSLPSHLPPLPHPAPLLFLPSPPSLRSRPLKSS